MAGIITRTPTAVAVTFRRPFHGWIAVAFTDAHDLECLEGATPEYITTLAKARVAEGLGRTKTADRLYDLAEREACAFLPGH